MKHKNSMVRENSRSGVVLHHYQMKYLIKTVFCMDVFYKEAFGAIHIPAENAILVRFLCKFIF